MTYATERRIYQSYSNSIRWDTPRAMAELKALALALQRSKRLRIDKRLVALEEIRERLERV